MQYKVPVASITLYIVYSPTDGVAAERQSIIPLSSFSVSLFFSFPLFFFLLFFFLLFLSF